MIVLGIETSCDETSASVFINDKIVSNQTYTQLIHSKYGGVVPEFASREHEKIISLIIYKALQKANVKTSDINCIGVTYGPGLMGALLVGVNFVKGMSIALGIPFIGINHLEGHIFANFIADPSLELPFICLLVSGGHTQLWYVKGIGEYKLLGETRDDAAGEAFDKGARILGLGYPGGPAIEKAAIGGNPNAVKFPRSLMGKNNLEFSFSGLKTSLLYFMDDYKETKKLSKKDIIASYQQAIIDVLIKKVTTAMNINNVDKCVIAGGVAANQCLRNGLRLVLGDNRIMFPDLSYCTDNGAMISYLGEKKIQLKKYESLSFSSQPNLKLS